MKIIYIGQYSEGTTSKMRANALAKIFGEANFQVIDIHTPFHSTPSLIKSFGARFKKGPLIKKINAFIQKELNSAYDLIWVDKGVFINKETLELLKRQTKKLIHFTPDMAFYINKSSLFIDNMDLYDFIVTTKSAEIDFYKNHVPSDKIIVVKQGFDSAIHKKYYQFSEKEKYVSFIGHFENYRGKIIKELMNAEIKVKLVGKGWSSFINENKNNPYFNFISEGIYGQEYAKFISKSMMSLGFIMKRVPEFHTTRTFEIPACNTALITENNDEIKSFYSEDEALFYSDEKDLIAKIRFYFSNLKDLKSLTEKGYLRVNQLGCDYSSIISEILHKTNIIAKS